MSGWWVRYVEGVPNNRYSSVYVITRASTLADKCSALRTESAPARASRQLGGGGDVVVTRSGGLSKGLRGYNWRILCPIYITFSESNSNLGFNPQIRRARDALGLRGPHGAGKAVGVGLWGSSICAGAAQSAGLRAAKWLSRNSEMKNVGIWRVGDVGGVAAVGLGMTGKVWPGGGVKTSRLIVSCIVLPQPIEVCC